MIMPIDIVNYLYCPRYIYYQYVLGIPQYEEKYFLVIKGREIHDLKAVRNKEYLRKRIGVIKKHITPYLSNGILRGKPDEILELSDGTIAPLEYKFSQFEGRIYPPIRQQLWAYAVLAEDVYQKPVNKGFVVYVRSKNHLETIEITDRDKQLVRQTAWEILKIINEEIYPEATKTKNKCLNCTYRKICVY